MAASSGDSSASSALEYAINHIFLPPKTPQDDDPNIEQQHELASSLLQSINHFSQQCSAAESQQLRPVVLMLQRLLKVKPGLRSSTKRAAMKDVIRELDNGGTYTVVCIFFSRASH
jgi:hypothetical protein